MEILTLQILLVCFAIYFFIIISLISIKLFKIGYMLWFRSTYYMFFLGDIRFTEIERRKILNSSIFSFTKVIQDIVIFNKRETYINQYKYHKKYPYGVYKEFVFKDRFDQDQWDEYNIIIKTKKKI